MCEQTCVQLCENEFKNNAPHEEQLGKFQYHVEVQDTKAEPLFENLRLAFASGNSSSATIVTQAAYLPKILLSLLNK
jgi:hypothetical protein